MKVRELIEALSQLDPDLPVGYINECADDGASFCEVYAAQVDTSQQRRYIDPMNIPARFVVLS